VEARASESFSFYRQGTVSHAPVRAETSGASLLESCRCIAFSLSGAWGERSALFLVLFERSLDASMYTEMANVLASRLATRISREHQADVTLSPPRQLADAALRAMLADGRAERDEYIHADGNGRETRLFTRLFIGHSKEPGNA
jgi:hypothetical protein